MKRKHILMGMFALSAVMLLGSCANNNGDNPSQNNSSQTTQNSLAFASCVLTADEEVEGKLTLKATSKDNLGTIYYGLTKTEAEYTVAQLVTPDAATFVKSGNGAGSVEVTFTDLEAGATYYGYFVIKDGENYSTIRKASATTHQVVDMGTGTEDDPFRISTIAQLEAVGSGTDNTFGLNLKDSAYYVLTNDIDLSEKYGADKENSWTPIKSLKGVFDGKGFKVSNLYINSPNYSEAYIGLFSQVNTTGTLKNLTVEDVTIIASGSQENARKVKSDGTPDTSDNKNLKYYSSQTKNYVGALTGDVKGVVENCHVENATITLKGSRGGGLAGRLYSDAGTASKILNSSVKNTTITGTNRLGGIVGLVDGKGSDSSSCEGPYTQAVIENCTFQGKITGSNINLVDPDKTANPTGAVTAIVCAEYIGGIAGYYRSCDIKNAVVNATLEGYRYIGGVVGFQQYNKYAGSSTAIEEPATPADIGKHYSTINGAIVKVDLKGADGVNKFGPIVGNKSVKFTSSGNQNNGEYTEIPVTDACASNYCYYLSTSTFKAGETDKTYDKLDSTAKSGDSADAATIDAAWYKTNLASFNFTDVFKLDETTKLPVLK